VFMGAYKEGFFLGIMVPKICVLKAQQKAVGFWLD
jgi:hypothetical protein